MAFLFLRNKKQQCTLGAGKYGCDGSRASAPKSGKPDFNKMFLTRRNDMAKEKKMVEFFQREGTDLDLIADVFNILAKLEFEVYNELCSKKE